MSVHEEITLELARLQRKALENVRRRNAEQQLGEAWVGLSSTSSDSETRTATERP